MNGTRTPTEAPPLRVPPHSLEAEQGVLASVLILIFGLRQVNERLKIPALSFPLAGLHEAVLRVRPVVPAPAPEKVKLQYWHGIWNGKPDPIRAETGAGGAGWDRMDDWTNGKWIDAETSVAADGATWSYSQLMIACAAAGDWGVRTEDGRFAADALLPTIDDGRSTLADGCWPVACGGFPAAAGCSGGAGGPSAAADNCGPGAMATMSRKKTEKARITPGTKRGRRA